MAKASWGGKVIAESNATVVVEGNQYFPLEAVKKEALKPSKHTTVCPWKGTAHYYHVEVDGIRNDNAAWYYPAPPKSKTASRSGKACASRSDRSGSRTGISGQNRNAKIAKDQPLQPRACTPLFPQLVLEDRSVVHDKSHMLQFTNVF